jgi:hypothetical protein
MREFIRHILREHVKTVNEVRFIWTKDNVEKEAKKYTTRNEFKKNNSSAYRAALKYGWMDDVSKHMTPVQQSWDYETVKNIASQYKTKKEFRQNNRKAYDIATYHKWLPSITKHMESLGNLYLRKIYVFEFPDKSAYIGLTLNPEQRQHQHLSLTSEDKTAVQRYIKETNLTPIFKILTDDFLPVKEAQVTEQSYIDEYAKNGWKILNKVSAGALGNRDRFYTLDMVKNEAEKYNTIKDFKRNSPKFYNAASRYNWLKDITQNLERNIISWSKDKILQISQNYTKLSDFVKQEPKAVDAARRNGWFDEVTSHMSKKQYWTPDTVRDEAKKYETQKEFQRNSPSAFNFAYKHGLLKDISTHMKSGKVKWTEDDILKVSDIVKDIKDFRENYPKEYDAIYRQTPEFRNFILNKIRNKGK